MGQQRNAWGGSLCGLAAVLVERGFYEEIIAAIGDQPADVFAGDGGGAGAAVSGRDEACTGAGGGSGEQAQADGLH